MRPLLRCASVRSWRTFVRMSWGWKLLDGPLLAWLVLRSLGVGEEERTSEGGGVWCDEEAWSCAVRSASLVSAAC